MLTQQDLEDATLIVRRHVPVTPAYRWPLLEQVTGTPTWVKHENATPTGAFKVRGGLVYVERLLAAVVAQPDPKWGETPCAFIELKEGASATQEELIEFCRSRMARFKAPKSVVFGPLPKTSTGKIQKFILRERAKSTAAIE